MIKYNAHPRSRGYLVVIVLELLAQGSCGNEKCGDWIELDDSCYLFSTMNASWAEAVALCRAFMSNLVEIHSFEETNAINSHLLIMHGNGSIRHFDYWIGGNDIEKEGRFKWIGSQEEFGYTNWMNGQPDQREGYQDCVEMRGVSGLRWHDEHCPHQHLFICERPPQSYGDGQVFG